MEGVDINRWEQAGAGEQRANPTHPTPPHPSSRGSAPFYNWLYL